MVLIVTNRQDFTADFLILELRRRGARYARFNSEDYPQRATLTWRIVARDVEGTLILPRTVVRTTDLVSVWFRRPVPPFVAPELRDEAAREFAFTESEAALHGFWRTLKCCWVSHPDRLQHAESKLRQLQVASALGLKVPTTIVTSNPSDALAFWEEHSASVVFKPLRRSRLERGDKETLIYTNPVPREAADCFDQVRYAPSMLQEYVHKHLEIRVTVVGQQVFAAAIDSQGREDSRHDWRRGDSSKLPHYPHQLPAEVEAKCIALVHSLGLAFGAIDLVLTPSGDYVFLEINPNGQWAWIQQKCPSLRIRESLADLLMAGGNA